MNEFFYRIANGSLIQLPIDADVECCACRWIKGYGDCGHGESDGLTSPHIHCRDHAGEGLQSV